MPRVIQGLYEITEEIGSGGSGIVYLARHQRLDKLVVLKAMKRRLSFRPETCRREVDALKNLSHQYIPQVYDFIVEDGFVYTVMDYIEGESFDKSLKQGARYAQSLVVVWAAQLLQALSYLHARPPYGLLHADIKPANIMLTPQGDIRLIDFNIALALGAEGAIAVGRSLGYASPEHWGLDFTPGGEAASRSAINLKYNPKVTTVLDAQETGSAEVLSVSGAQGKKIMLDVRSDIYGVGATLYHMLSGVRPAHHVDAVAPLSDKLFEGGLVAVINKAMNPDPNLRFQSADEMLDAVLCLRERDPRALRWKRVRNTVGIGLAVLFVMGGATAFAGLRQMEAEQRQIARQERQEAAVQRENAERQRAEAAAQRARALAATAKEALENGDKAGAVRDALAVLEASSDFAAAGEQAAVSASAAQYVLTAALGVYEVSDGFQSHALVSLPSAPLKTAIAPGGATAAAVTKGMLTVFDTETAKTVVSLPTVASALADVHFMGDDRVLYAGDSGISLYDLVKGEPLWTGALATEIAVSADGTTIAAIYKDEGVVTVYNAAGDVTATVSLGEKKQRVAVNDVFANPGDNLLALSGDGQWLAVSFADGGLTLFSLADANNNLILYEASEFFHFEGGFFGSHFAFSSIGTERSAFAVIDLVSAAQTGGFESPNPFHVVADETGIFLSNEAVVVQIDPVSGDQEEIAYVPALVENFSVGGGKAVVGARDHSFAFFDGNARQIGRFDGRFLADFVAVGGDYAIVGSRDAPFVRVMRYRTTEPFFSYDPAYAHDEARLSADGTTVMLFSYKGFRLHGINGETLKTIVLPEADQIYDQQYRRGANGSYLEVYYNDGRVDRYAASDGEQTGAEQRKPPDLSLEETFLTDTFRIVSPLHGAAVVYDRDGGQRVTELAQEAYLTYVTQLETSVMTEYISTEGRRFGVLIDGKTAERLAYLPNLCDIAGDSFIFDDGSGKLWMTNYYTTDYLIEQGKR